MTSARNIASAAILSLLLMVSVAYYWPIEETYHPLNSEWNGCSRIANTARNVTMLYTYNKPLANPKSLLAIIGPSTDFSRDQSSKIADFLKAGGSVLLADDFGTGNGLLEALNVSASFSGKPLADLYSYSRAPSFPLITVFSATPATINVTAIVLNHPSYINIENSSVVTKIGSSSPFSFIDSGGDGRPLPNETIDSYPVIASTIIGRGVLILVADPSMFINDMTGLYDNLRMFRNILKTGDGSAVFDVAHLGNAPLTNWRILLKNEIDSLRLGKDSTYTLLFVVVALGLGFTFQLARLTRRGKTAE